MSKDRPVRQFRLNGWKNDPDFAGGLAVYGEPAETRMYAAPESFVAVKKGSVSLSPGLGGDINLQAMSQNMKYGGMLIDLPFPMSIMPINPMTPFPNQIFLPPFLQLLPQIRELAQLASFFVGMTTGM